MKKFLSFILVAILFISVSPRVFATQSRTGYFSKEYTLTGDPTNDMLAVAQAQLGRTQSQMGYTEAWCANFVSDCAKLAGQSSAIPANGYVPTFYNAILSAGGQRVYSRQKGDIIFYNCSACDTDGDGLALMHVGIVLDETYSIEGNYNNKVAKASSYTDQYGHKTSTGTITRIYVRPNYNGMHTHSYVEECEALHPHKVYKKCYGCGDWEYTGATWKLSNCSLCTAHTHSYSSSITKQPTCTATGVRTYTCSCGSSYTESISALGHDYSGARLQEAAHPHEISQRCVRYSTCGRFYWTGENGCSSDCDRCWYATFDLSSTSISMEVGESETIFASVGGCYPDSRVLSAEYDEDFIEVTVSEKSLTFKGLKVGSGRFKLILYSDSTKSYIIGSKSINITITKPEPTLDYIKTNNPNKLLYYMGEKLDTTGLVVRLCYSDGSYENVTSGYTVSGFDSSTEGRKTVTVTYKGKTATFEVYVAESSVSLSKKSLTMNIGETHTIYATTDPVGESVKWSTSNSKVVTVSNGKITAIGVGTAQVNVTFYYNGYYSFATCNVTVKEENHTYDNSCDTTCNGCGAVRSIKHTYTNACDTSCNVCGATRTITHSYKNVVTNPTCTAQGYTTHTCSVCGDSYKDTYVAKLGHSYDNACDANCNVCGTTRTPSAHVYDHIYDADCNVCGETREAAEYEWSINVTKTGVYALKPNKNYTGNFEVENIAVYDKNGKEVYYYEKLGGFPLVTDQEYTVKFRYDCSDEISGTVSWTKTRKYDTIFPDTTTAEKGGWYNNAIAYVVGRNIMSGYGSTGLFGTADNIQRQDFMVMLARLDGVDLSQYENTNNVFPDVPQGSYYEAAVMWGYENGIVSGYANGKFGTGDKITREQLVKFLYNYANYKGLDTNYSAATKQTVKNKYKDYKNVSDWAQDAVLWAIENNVIKGKTDTTIVPYGNALRCEVAQIMYNIFLNDLF